MWMYVMLVAVLAGTIYGGATPAGLEESNVLGQLLGMGATIGGVMLAVLLLLTLQQHSETEQAAVVLAGILEGVFFSKDTQTVANYARDALNGLARRFEQAFAHEDQEKLPGEIREISKVLPENESTELITAWRRLHAIANRRVHWTFWLAMSIFLFWTAAATMSLAVNPVYRLLINAAMAFFSALVVDIDNPFAGIFNLKNPFQEAESD